MAGYGPIGRMAILGIIARHIGNVAWSADASLQNLNDTFCELVDEIASVAASVGDPRARGSW